MKKFSEVSILNILSTSNIDEIIIEFYGLDNIEYILINPYILRGINNHVENMLKYDGTGDEDIIDVKCKIKMFNADNIANGFIHANVDLNNTYIELYDEANLISEAIMLESPTELISNVLNYIATDPRW